MDTLPTASRADELESLLDDLILKIMINLSQRGYDTPEVLAALDAVCERRHREYEDEPNTAEDLQIT